MARIPRTREEFDRMEFRYQSEAKKNLLIDNFSTMCDSVNPQYLKEFSQVLHSSDQEELALKRDRLATPNLASDLLMAIKCSMHKKPTWWEVLERVLAKEQSWDMYYALNPWSKGERNEGAAGGGGGDGGGGEGGGGRRGGGGGGGGIRGAEDPEGLVPSATPPTRPLQGEARLLPAVRGPYALSIPLSQTRGVHRCLEPLFAGGHDTLWRDLAEHLGVQRTIVKKSKANDTHRVLLDQFIETYEDAATIDSLVQALRALGPEGQRVVRHMEQSKLIPPLQRSGSQADGEVVAEAYDDAAGGTSARFAQAPTPRLPAPPGNTGEKFRTDLANLSVCQPCKEERLPEKKVGVSEAPQAGVSSPVVETDRLNELDENEMSRMNSIVENSLQSEVSPTPPADDKILNRSPPSTPPGHYIVEDAGGNEETNPRSREKLPSPGQPVCPSEETPRWIRSSQEDILSQCTPPQQGVTEAQQPPQQSKGVTVNVFLNNANNVVFNPGNNPTVIKDSAVIGEGDDDSEHHPPTPATQESAEGGHAHMGGLEEEEHQEDPNCEDLPSYHPDPLDASAHETRLKEIDREEQHLSAPEGDQDLSDIIDLRQDNDVNVTDRAGRSRDDSALGTSQGVLLTTPEDARSVSRDTASTTAPVPEEVNNCCPSSDDPTPSLPPPHDLVSQQPPSPPPPSPLRSHQGGMMTTLSTAWVSVKDAFLGME